MRTNNSGTTTIAIAFLGFIGLGMSGGLLGIAWPSMQKEFGLQLDAVNQIYLVQTAAYTLASFYIGRLMSRYTSGTTLLVACVLLAVGLFGYAVSSAWPVIVGLSLIWGLGSGTLDAGLNLYVAAYHSAQQMNWLHASFGLGLTVGPLIMTFVLERAFGWQVGYAVVGAVIVCILCVFAVSRKLWRNEGFQTADNKPVQRVTILESLRVPALWFGMVTFLMYVGVEIGLVQWAYLIMYQSRGISSETAGIMVGIYLAVFTGGRAVFGVIANRFDVNRVLRYCILAMIVGALLFWWNPALGGSEAAPLLRNAIGLIGLVIVGAAEAPVFPMLMAGTARRIGPEHAENAISLQMTAVGIGIAILPGLIGTVGKDFGLEMMAAGFVVMTVITFIFHEFALLGHAAEPVLHSAGD